MTKPGSEPGFEPGFEPGSEIGSELGKKNMKWGTMANNKEIDHLWNHCMPDTQIENDKHKLKAFTSSEHKCAYLYPELGIEV